MLADEMQGSMTKIPFSSSGLSEQTLLGIPHAFMSQVQAESIQPILGGTDFIVRAKTGTGKTIAYLAPSIDRVANRLKSNPSLETSGKILMLVIAPTRELAEQIASDAEKLVLYHKSLRPACVYGGHGIEKDERAIEERRPNILIGTPGRLLDLLKNAAGFAQKFSDLVSLVLDEVDFLLDQGMKADILAVVKYLPVKSSRQNLLFSATIPRKILDLSSILLNSYKYIDCIGEGDSTHQNVSQEYFACPLKLQLPYLLLFIKLSAKAQRYKIMVFCLTSYHTSFIAEVLRLSNYQVIEMHSRLTQNKRTKSSQEFKSATNCIMVTSDVSARGMDYPDVTRIIQVGLPSSKDQYIHRVGRTSRGLSKSGTGFLLLCDFEEGYVRKYPELKLQKLEPHFEKNQMEQAKKNVANLISKIPEETTKKTYFSFMGFYVQQLAICFGSKEKLVEALNFWIMKICLLKEIPGNSTAFFQQAGIT